ncbi:MAG: O-antigen ligase family protein [Candidatus Moraniibacteriota bacterium]
MANLTEKIGNIWKEAKKQPKDIWLFYLFLLTFTLGVRKVMFYFPLKGAFNEYTGAYVYASDIFLCLVILVWIISILYDKIAKASSSREDISEVIHKIDYPESVNNAPNQNLSTGLFAYIKPCLIKMRKMFHVEHFNEQYNAICSTPACRSLSGGWWNNFCSVGIFLLPLLLIVWSFISVYWSENQAISIYRSVRFLELYFLCIYIVIRFVPYCILNCSTWNNLRSENVENVPRGTFSDESGSNNEKMFHLSTGQAGVEHFNCVLSKMAQYFRAILLGLIVIALFDHYLWDIWQGQVLFWLVCGILVGIGFWSSDFRKCSTWNISSKDFYQIVPPTSAKALAGKRGTINAAIVFFGIIMITGITQALIGIAQFILQHSIGLFWLKESLIGPDIAGVAKIIANYHPLIRAYGLFPHPNLLGGFLFFSIIMTMLYIKLFHVEQFKAGASQADPIENCSTWNNFKSVMRVNVPRGTFGLDLIKFALVIQVIGVFLSFSKSAILALTIALVYINVPPSCAKASAGKRGTISRETIKKLFHPPAPRLRRASVEQFRILLGLGFAVLIGLLFLRVEFYALFMKSLEERGLYLSISQRIISESPIIGAGTGQFIFEAERLFPDLAIWQYQPVHNIFLLIWSEWGIVGLVLFIVFLWKLFHVEQFDLKPSSPFGRGCHEHVTGEGKGDIKI